jgi:hypothetical protein
MLNEHPHVYVLDETHWVPKLHELFGDGAAPAGEMLDVVDRTHHVDGRPTTVLPARARSAIAAVKGPITVRAFADIVGDHLAAAHEKARWADKTPDYIAHMSLIQSLWPACRFVHLIRDGVAVAQSMAAHPGYRVLVARRELSWVALAYGAGDLRDTAPPSDADAFLRLWRMRVERARAESARLVPGTYFEARFERLCLRPRETLAEVAAFVGLPDAEGPWAESAAAQVVAERATRRPADPQPIADRRACELLQQLGYEAAPA